MALPKISVILPVRNEVDSLGGLLDQLLQQEYPVDSFEILVADGRSTDGTRALVEQKASKAAVPLRVIDNPGIRSGAGRNAGVSRRDGRHHFVYRWSLRNSIEAIVTRHGACCWKKRGRIAYAVRSH